MLGGLIVRDRACVHGKQALACVCYTYKKNKLSGVCEIVTDLHILHLMRLRGPPGVSGYLANISVSTKLPSPSAGR